MSVGGMVCDIIMIRGRSTMVKFESQELPWRHQDPRQSDSSVERTSSYVFVGALRVIMIDTISSAAPPYPRAPVGTSYHCHFTLAAE
jgi:hypothetical protein